MPYEPKPGICACLGFCGKTFQSPDVRKNRICPRCTKKQNRESTVRSIGVRVYNDNKPMSAE